MSERKVSAGEASAPVVRRRNARTAWRRPAGEGVDLVGGTGGSSVGYGKCCLGECSVAVHVGPLGEAQAVSPSVRCTILASLTRGFLLSPSWLRLNARPARSAWAPPHSVIGEDANCPSGGARIRVAAESRLLVPLCGRPARGTKQPSREWPCSMPSVALCDRLL